MPRCLCHEGEIYTLLSANSESFHDHLGYLLSNEYLYSTILDKIIHFLVLECNNCYILFG